jgi:hypothetical protein
MVWNVRQGLPGTGVGEKFRNAIPPRDELLKRGEKENILLRLNMVYSLIWKRDIGTQNSRARVTYTRKSIPCF